MGCNCNKNRGQRNVAKGRSTVGPRIQRNQRDVVTRKTFAPPTSRQIAQQQKSQDQIKAQAQSVKNIGRLDANRKRIEKQKRNAIKKRFHK